MNRGRFITLEGGEGSGKSTQVKKLQTWLADRHNIEAIVTREPGGTPDAEAIRSLLVGGRTDRWDPMTEVLLHFAARRNHVTNVIWPALDAGTWVICDRFVDSTRAYQGIVQGVGIDTVTRMARETIGDFEPDLTLLLDITIERSRDRITGRSGNNRYEQMGETFHVRLRDAYLAIARESPGRIRIVDADGSVDDVASRIFGVVEGLWF